MHCFLKVWVKTSPKWMKSGLRVRYKANTMFVCLCVHHRHSRIPFRAAAAGGLARCHGLLYIQCGCVMQFGAKRCAQQAKQGCTGHDGRAKPAWATRTGPIGAPRSVQRSWVPTSPKKVHNLMVKKENMVGFQLIKLVFVTKTTIKWMCAS